MELTPPATPASTTSIPKSLLAAIVASFILLVFLIAAVQLLWARHHLLAGAGGLNAAITIVKSPVALENGSLRTSAIHDLRQARYEFVRARADFDLWAGPLSTLGWIPKYGGQRRAAAPASAAVYYATTSALDVVKGSHGLLAQLRTHRRALLPRMARALAPGVADFLQAESQADQGMASLRLLPARIGVSSLQSDVGKLRKDLPRLRAAAAWLSVMPTILADGATQRYLFCWENAAEIRPTGGFIGAVDLVSIRHGVVAKRFSGSALEHRYPLIKPPVPEAVTTLETTWIFRDSNVSPDFPFSARLERWFYHKNTGTAVNGVVDFVDQGISDLLSATGPIYLKPYHVTVNAGNAQKLANRFASARPVPFRGPISPRKINLDTYRKQFLGFEFAAILHRLQTLPPSRWGVLGQAMAQAIRRKDVLIWSPRPRIERAVNGSDAGGELRPRGGDFLYVTDDNRSYNKIGPYVGESAQYRTELVQGDWLDSALTLRYHLKRSPSWMEGFGPGLGTLGNKHQFRDFVRVYVPPGALVQPVRGLNQAAPLGFIGRSLAGQAAYGLTQIGGWFTISPGQTKVFRINYSIPANDLAYDNFRHYRLTLLRQPGTRLRGVAIRIRGVGGAQLILESHSVPAYRTWLPLSRDQSLSIPLEGTSQPSLIPPIAAQRADPLISTSDLSGFTNPRAR